MKIAIITDTHFGSRNDNKALINFFDKFYKNVFFPEIDKRKITKIWHLGDLVDRRKYINFHTLNFMKSVFIEEIGKRNIQLNVILGNHDMYFKNQITPNALDELLLYDFVKVYSKPTIVENITVIPWMCEENRDECYKLIDSNQTKFLFGHLQLSGFEMDRGRFAEDGSDPSGFVKYDAVLTGHFHHKSSYSNIHYLGAPYEMTWKDFDDVKGFHIFDDETGELEFIENPNRIFLKYVYDDESKTHAQMVSDISSNPNYVDSYLKLIVKSKNNLIGYEKFIDVLNENGVADLQIVDDHFNLNIETDELILGQAEDTMSILSKYVENSDLNVDKSKLTKLLHELYDEAGIMRV